MSFIEELKLLQRGVSLENIAGSQLSKHLMLLLGCAGLSYQSSWQGREEEENTFIKCPYILSLLCELTASLVTILSGLSFAIFTQGNEMKIHGKG